MAGGGMFGVDDIPWFNGGLFKKIHVPQLQILDVTELRNAAALNWSAIDVSIFGTLFERGLDPAKRSQLGAHYTDPATILRIVEPVVQRPLRAVVGSRSAKDIETAACAQQAPSATRPTRHGQGHVCRLAAPAARLPRARPCLWQRQLPVPWAQGPEGHRAQEPPSTPPPWAWTARPTSSPARTTCWASSSTNTPPSWHA
jgi:hypothetical protein